MNTIEKLKLTAQLKKTVDERNSETNTIKKLKLAKQVQELRKQLGMGMAKATPSGKTLVNDNDIQPLQIDDKSKVKKAVEKYLSQFRDKYITTVDGKNVVFNSKGRNHLANDVVFGENIVASAIEKVVEVLTQGQFIEVQPLKKVRNNDDYVAFHKYRKWVVVDNIELHLQIKVAQLKDGSFEVGNGLIVYSAKNAENEKEATPPVSQSFDSLPINSEDYLFDKENIIFDSISQENYVFLEILEVKPLKEGWDGKIADIPQTAYQLHDKSTTTKRQKDNDTAVALMRELQASGRKATAEEKAILSRYTGTGGNLVGENGLKGSDYEYYTPIEVAKSMWDLMGELGFKGGAVLDPSSGTGIFSASSPDAALMHSVELSDVSGGINALINDKPTHKVTVSPFEKVASSTDDETMDAVITNVPFGDVSARGENRFFDDKYQKDSLEEYFIKRSLDKLKPNGLAMFIVPTKILDGSNFSKFRRSILLRAELLGAYRLPNKVFDKTGADVTTDIVVFKKFASDVGERIVELEKTNSKILKEANVLNENIIRGKYFEHHKAHVLGEYQTGKGRYGDVVRVVNNDSLANILKMVKKFPKSSINYELLGAVDVAIGEPTNGDVRVMDGDTFVWENGQWVQSKESVRFDESPYLSALDLAVNKKTRKDVTDYQGYLQTVGRKPPLWLEALTKNAKNDDELTYWACLLATAEALKDERNNGYAVRYPELTEQLKAIAPTYQKGGLKTKNTAYKSLQKSVSVVFGEQGGLSDFWLTGKKIALLDAALNSTQSYENAVYRGMADNWQVDVSLIKESNPDFDPLTSDEFCVNADGSKVTLARDYYVGNFGEFLEKINADIDSATSPIVKAKLIKQKEHAQSLIKPSNPYNIKFGLMSKLVPMAMKYRFFHEYVDGRTIFDDGKLVMDDKDKTEFSNVHDKPNGDDYFNKKMRAYLLNKIFVSINNNQKLQFSDKAFKELDADEQEILIKKATQYVRELDLDFNSWIKTNKTYMDELSATMNDPYNKEFTPELDGSPIEIDNFKPKYKGFTSLHDYQFEEVKRLSRSFSGICGFDVGLGKAQPLTAKILTPNGWKLMGDIQIGDEVITQDGTTTRVTGVFPQGEKEIFTVKFSDGAMTQCCDEHLWLTQTEKDRKTERYSRSKGVGRVESGSVKTLSEIKETLIYQTQKNHKIPMVSPIQFAHKAFAINPYLLGVLLGDGNLTGRRVAFCTPDDEVIERVLAIIQQDFKNDIYVRVRESENRTIQHYFSRVNDKAPNPIRDELRQLGLCEKYSHEKFIPAQYLCGSIEQRIDLLHGLMDTDGYVSKDGVTIQYYSTSEQMANGMIALVQSLGGIAWKKLKQGRYKKDNGEVVECKICYIVSIRMPSNINPFYLSRKKDRVKPKSKYVPVRYITEVTLAGVAQAQCISVEHSSHLYVTDDYIVTHNTATSLATIQNLHNIGVKKRTLIVVPNHTISKWRKDIDNVYDDVSDVLMIGTDENKNSASMAKYNASDLSLLTTAKGAKYRKILMTAEAFTSIPMREQTLRTYFELDNDMERNSDVERGKSRQSGVVKALNKYENKLPYFEDMAIDSIVFDEGQLYKNNLEGGQNFNRIKGLSAKSIDQVSARGLSARVKSWYVRGQNAPLSDGVVLLTATPFTNSPSEILSMIALAIGDEKAKKLFGGGLINDLDDFLSMFANVEALEQRNIINELITIDTFTGFVNADLLKETIHTIANIQTASERGLKIPDVDLVKTAVDLPSSDKAVLDEMKRFYKLAKHINKGGPLIASPELMDSYMAYKEQTGDTDELIGHAFSLISRMSELTLVGSDMALNRNVVLDFDPKDEKKAKQVAYEFNNLKSGLKFETTRRYPHFESETTKTDKQGNDTTIYTVKAQAQVEDNRLILNVDDATILAKLMDIIQKHELDLRPKLSAKTQALMDNIKVELSQPKHEGYAKQLIFCDTLSMHHIIKQSLVAYCGVPSSQIAILNAQTLPDGKAGNPDTEEVQYIQDKFAENHYTIVIANKKAETGIDLQRGTQAIHHLTTGWTPDSLAQRNGRGVRQGNTQEIVTVYEYNANGTFDEYKRHLISNKADWIDSLMQKHVDTANVLNVSQELTEADYEDLINADSPERIAELIKAKQERDEKERQERINAKNDHLYRKMIQARQNAKDLDFETNLKQYLLDQLNQALALAKKTGDKNKAKKERILSQFDGFANFREIEIKIRNNMSFRNSKIYESDLKKLLNDDYLMADSPMHRHVKNVLESKERMLDVAKNEYLNNADDGYTDKEAVVAGEVAFVGDVAVKDGEIFIYTDSNNDKHHVIARVRNNDLELVSHAYYSESLKEKFNALVKVPLADYTQAVADMAEEELKWRPNATSISSSMVFANHNNDVLALVEKKLVERQQAKDNEMVEADLTMLVHQETGFVYGEDEWWLVFEDSDNLDKVKAVMREPFRNYKIVGNKIHLKRVDYENSFRLNTLAQFHFYSKIGQYLLANNIKLNLSDSAVGDAVLSQLLQVTSIDFEKVTELPKSKYATAEVYNQACRKVFEHVFGAIIANGDEIMAKHGFEFFKKEIVPSMSYFNQIFKGIEQHIGELSLDGQDPKEKRKADLLERAKIVSRDNGKGVELVALMDSGWTLKNNKEVLKSICEKTDGKKAWEWDSYQKAWYVSVEALHELVNEDWFDFVNFLIDVPSKYK